MASPETRTRPASTKAQGHGGKKGVAPPIVPVALDTPSTKTRLGNILNSFQEFDQSMKVRPCLLHTRHLSGPQTQRSQINIYTALVMNYRWVCDNGERKTSTEFERQVF